LRKEVFSLSVHSILINQIDLSSRAKRRKAVNIASSLLERVRFAEEANIDNFPLNFRDSQAFANAEDRRRLLGSSHGRYFFPLRYLHQLIL